MQVATNELLEKVKIKSKIDNFKIELYPLFVNLTARKTKDGLFSFIFINDEVTYKRKANSQSFLDVALNLDDIVKWFNASQ